VTVAGIDTAVGIEATSSGTCALLAGGTVRCWGQGFAPGMVSIASSPVTLPGVVGAVSFGAGTTACYVDGSHAVWCWGLNTYGQLGNGTTTSSSVPVRVSGITTAVEVETGGGHTCARLTDGTLRCWGLGVGGALGDGAFADRTTPVAVDGISDAVDLITAPLADATCARLATGAVRCWGQNGVGQLGDGSRTSRGTPVTTILDQAAVDAAVDYGGGCAVLAGGALRCWGSNSYGELGVGPPVQLAPAPTLPMQAASGLALPGDASCALGTDSVVRCWGSRVAGELADGTGTGSARPVVVDLASVVQVAGTADHACARREDGTIWCWGRGNYGQLGDGSSGVTGSPPVQVSGVTTAIDVAAGNGLTCAVLAGGTVWCWGRTAGADTMTAVPTQVVGVTTATRVVAGLDFACALLVDASVTCWGSNVSGRLGSSGISVSLVPVAVPGVAGVTDLVARSDGACALLADHTVVCWGGSALGHEATGMAPVTGITTAVAIGAGSGHACAILASGQVTCWGDNFRGQLGDGTIVIRATPVTVPGITAVAIDGGAYHTCAITAAGAVQCWGWDALGQLGGGVRPFTTVPVPVDLRGVPPLAIVVEAPVATNTLEVPVSIAVLPGSPPARRFRLATWFIQPFNPQSWPTSVSSPRMLAESCGTCTFHGWAWSETGETASVATTTVIVDAVRPTATLTAPATTSTHTVPVVPGGADAQSGIGAWLLSETPVNPAANDTRWRETPPTTFTLSRGDGLKRVYVWTRDLAWNVSSAGQADVRLDTAAPTGLGTPGAGVVWSGLAAGTIPTRVGWTAARDLSPGAVTYAVAWQRTGSSLWQAVTLADPRSASAVLALAPGTYRVRVRAVDVLGHATPWRTGAWFTLRRYQESASAIRLVRGFRIVSIAGASGSKVATARVAGSTLTASFTGTSVAWVGVRGPDRGVARVYLDGKLVATVNLYASARTNATVVWRRSFGASRAHVVRIVATGTRGIGSSATWVDVDAVLVAR
jgi:alpha-tubulin suppressor-like RCC1 family protein